MSIDIVKCIDGALMAIGLVMVWFGLMMAVFQPSLDNPLPASLMLGLMSMFGGFYVVRVSQVDASRSKLKVEGDAE